jgi:hypothetical protein
MVNAMDREERRTEKRSLPGAEDEETFILLAEILERALAGYGLQLSPREATAGARLDESGCTMPGGLGIVQPIAPGMTGGAASANVNGKGSAEAEQV